MLLENKVGLVTGGASGIGRATALLMAREGAQVIVSDINEEAGEETAAQIRAAGGDARVIACNVAKNDQVVRLIEGTLQTYGRLDCAFNNAGVGGTMSPIDEKTEDEWDLVLGVNLKGVWMCIKYEIPALLASGGGSIVNMASVAGLSGFRNASAYAASKHGVVGLTRTAALEVARQNIRVNAVCPGFTDTPMVQAMVELFPGMKEATERGAPMRRLGTPQETAEAVVWLCSDKASFITGHALPIDGGMTAM
jgi:NAD(P)-dependent dehydrogenase (short-subunit alcohol dehydrogenase family)